MRRSARFWIVGALVLLALPLVVAVRLATLDPEALQREVERILSEALGVEVGGGAVHISLGWHAWIGADDLRVANLPGRPSPYLLEAERLDLSLRIWPLLWGRADVDGLVLRNATLRIEPAATPGALLPDPDWDALEDGPEGDALHIAVREFHAEELVVLVGDPDEARRITFVDLRLKAGGARENRSVRLHGDVDGESFRLAGLLGPAGALTDSAQPFPVELEGTALGAEWKVEASLDEPLQLRGLVIAALEVRTPGGEVHASGRVADARSFGGVDLAVQAQVSDGDLLERWLGGLPSLGSLGVDGSLGDADGSLGFEGKIVASAPSGDVEITLDGVHSNFDDLAGLDARFTLKASDGEALARFLGADLDLPSLAPIVAEGSVHGAGGRVGMRDVALTAGSDAGLWLRAAGGVENLADVAGVRFSGEFGASDTADLSAWVGRTLPVSGPLRGSFDLSDADGTLGFERLALRDGKGDGAIDFDVVVVAGDLRGGGEIVVDAEISSEAGLEPIGKLIGVGLPPVGPASWEGRVQGNASQLAVDGTLHVRDSDISAKGRWKEDAAGRGNLRLALDSESVHLADFGVSPDGWAGEGRREGRFDWATGEAAPSFERLRGLDAFVTFDARRMTGRGGNLSQDIHLDIELRQGLLSVRYEDRLDDSPVVVYFGADVSHDTPLLALDFQSERFDVNIPAAQLYADPRFQGLLDLDIELQARGSSSDEIARTLSGRVLVTGRDGTFAYKYSRAFFQDIFVRILVAGSERPPERYRCLKGDLEIERGVVTAGELWVNLEGMHLVGRGSADIAEKRWDLVVRPHVYGPGLIGGGATVEVRGPLAKPTFRARPLSIPVSLGETLVSRLLTPLQIVVRPFTGDSDPCLQLDAAAE